jgi:hypothetical protein
MRGELTYHLPLAEELNPDVLLADLHHYSQRSNAEGLIHSAWRQIEFALNQQNKLSDDLRLTYINNYASHLLACSMNASSETIQGHDTANRSEAAYSKALLISSYLPIFSKRAVQKPLTREDSSNLYQTLGAILQYQLDANDPQDLTENVTRGLSARTLQPEHILHLASPREESSDLQTINHDGYFVEVTDKLPVQIKLGQTALQYDSPVIVLDIDELLKNAVRFVDPKAIDEPAPFTGYVPCVAEYIAKEANGETLPRNQQRLLNIASQSLVRHYRLARELREQYDNLATLSA